ncbi:hypothetical protein EJ05DRAFT_483162 [Pseudovirgaria hyperparasitica]|uniref:Uncharacterized protein n=1 Tax=Pseudovirgaria hyperparasitica TaxID=470096 RepID=A0A6A6WCZ2_9PEZI|nr:uncharacterized protein EJ05DRAFT_483162 [Pseudovirgaria hyperparasitica]KAF2760702.1 hypothetical protein EJ05DRAFT_483162 [Pseudovirgaria hyperparasitica]
MEDTGAGTGSLTDTCLRACAHLVEHIDSHVLRDRVPWRLGKQIWLLARAYRREMTVWRTMANAYADALDDDPDWPEGSGQRPLRIYPLTLRAKHPSKDHCAYVTFEDLRLHGSSTPSRYVVTVTLRNAQVTLAELVSLAFMPNLAALVLSNVEFKERDLDLRTIRALEEKALTENGFSTLRLLIMQGYNGIPADALRRLESIVALQVVALEPICEYAYSSDQVYGQEVGSSFRLTNGSHPTHSSLARAFKGTESLHRNIATMLSTCLESRPLKLKDTEGSIVMNERAPILSLLYSSIGVNDARMPPPASKMNWFIRDDRRLTSPSNAVDVSKRLQDGELVSQHGQGKRRKVRASKTVNLDDMLSGMS